MIDSSGAVTDAAVYPLATASLRAPERFRSMLFDGGSDDSEGVIRVKVLRRMSPYNSYQRSDRTLTAEIGLYGPFYTVPDWLYFRRDHPERAERAYPDVRAWCANLDPRRADRLRNPAVRLYAEYVWGYVAAIRRAPLSSADRQECYRHLARWVANRALLVAGRSLSGRPRPAGGSASTTQPVISVDAVVAGQGPS
jgi:hypothetical protein